MIMFLNYLYGRWHFVDEKDGPLNGRFGWETVLIGNLDQHSFAIFFWKNGYLLVKLIEQLFRLPQDRTRIYLRKLPESIKNAISSDVIQVKNLKILMERLSLGMILSFCQWHIFQKWGVFQRSEGRGHENFLWSTHKVSWFTVGI